MLEKLIIENVAVIERAEVDFLSGLNVLTGETGAGKSIVIDSINLVLGMRSSRELIRTGAKQASVTAVFSDIPQKAEEQGFFADGDGKLIVERTVTAEGKGSAKVNGKIVSVSQLKELGELLAGIHGQHDNGALMDAERHIEFLDAYADNGILLQAYSEDYQKLRSLAERIRSLKTESRDRERRLELLRYELSEIEDAALTENEEEKLLEQRKRIRTSEKIKRAFAQAIQALNDSNSGASELSKDAARALESTEDIDEGVKAIRERILSASYELSDCAEELRNRLDGEGIFDIDPAAVEARLDIIYRLKSKYGNTYSEIMAYRDKAKKEIEENDNRDEIIAKLTEEYTVIRNEITVYAERLSETRKQASQKLCARVREELSFLNMAGAEFYAEVKMAEAFLPNGADTVEFMLSANRGETARPLAKIASGGELSRIMLAIKNALSEREGVPTQIFDEIDTGVSGKAAGRIGIKLKQISKGRQVLCVTHLSQIAAFADRHLLIEKQTLGDRTYTLITPLSREERVTELARIMSGDAAGEAARVGAEELLRYAEEQLF